MTISAITATDLRHQLTRVLDRVQDDPVAVTSRGEVRAVVVSPAFFRRAAAALSTRSASPHRRTTVRGEREYESVAPAPVSG